MSKSAKRAAAYDQETEHHPARPTQPPPQPWYNPTPQLLPTKEDCKQRTTARHTNHSSRADVCSGSSLASRQNQGIAGRNRYTSSIYSSTANDYRQTPKTVRRNELNHPGRIYLTTSDRLHKQHSHMMR